MIDREARTTFANISELYDKARISYPQPLINDIIDFSKLEKRDKILDVGCGTGQATILFAQKSFNVVGLDLGKDLIEVARKKCSSFSNVDFEISTFEDADFPDELFDLIISGMAWHWIKPEGREEKAYKILKENGTLALFWSYQRKWESSFVQTVGKVLDNYGGIDRGPAGSKVKQISDSLHNEFRKSKLFSQVELKEYDEDIQFTKEKYLNLVVSYGWVQKLSEEKRNQLIEDLQELLKKYEEPLIVPYRYVLVLARKSQSPA
jgi:ubiquinone/menaquinone biosynthesis C-methylase UbiE